MKCGRTRIIAILALLTVLPVRPVSLLLFAPFITAEDTDDEANPIDMETDNDGNGIPDEFEAGVNEVLALAEQGASGAQGADGDSREAALDAMEEFVNRIPVRPQTRRLQGHITTYARRIMETDSERRRDVIVGKIENMQ